MFRSGSTIQSEVISVLAAVAELIKERNGWFLFSEQYFINRKKYIDYLNLSFLKLNLNASEIYYKTIEFFFFIPFHHVKWKFSSKSGLLNYVFMKHILKIIL